ncbi:MAG TPA: hypothetical protein VKA44_03280 [Gemmatimonadota bacterium]|nr:hypothetical protein [Gemmatimonadota bacterium]
MIRDLASDAETASEARYAADGDAFASAGVGVLLVGTSRLRPRLETWEEAEQRVLSVRVLGGLSTGEVSDVYRRHLPAFEERAREDEASWRKLIDVHVCGAHRLVELIGARAEALGRGLEVDEIREAWEEAEGEEAPRTLTAEVSSLKRRGVLRAAGGRPGHTLYAPAGMTGLTKRREDDDAVIVLDALRRFFEREGWAASTRAVEQEIRAGERELTSQHVNAVKRYLDTLARETVRGPKSSRAPELPRSSGSPPPTPRVGLRIIGSRRRQR